MSSSTTLLQTSLWMLRTANELSLSSNMVDLRYVFNLFIVEKLLSASQLDTGRVAKILNTLILNTSFVYCHSGSRLYTTDYFHA